MALHSIFEIIMLMCFGFAWPFSIAKSWRSRTAAGKSVYFLFVVVMGYLAGVMKCLHDPAGTPTIVLAAYSINACIVSLDVVLYFRNRRLDQLRELGNQT